MPDWNLTGTSNNRQPIADRYGRRFRKLRISLTSACNYACTYCVPTGVRLTKTTNELDARLMVRATRLLKKAAGIDELRITGGEPLISPYFDSLLPSVMAMGFKDVSLTTNGQLLYRKLPVIKAGAMRRINISLDTLSPLRFEKIARGGTLASVLKGIETTVKAGIKVKVNMVPMRGVNHDEVLRMLDFCLAMGIELRYIELMRMGHLAHSADFGRQFFGMEEILDAIAAKYLFFQAQSDYDATARRFEIPALGHFGVIANESHPFCNQCTRLRLTSDGRLFGCLSNQNNYDIRPVLSLPEEEAVPRLTTLLNKAMADKQSHAFSGEATVMRFIGG